MLYRVRDDLVSDVPCGLAVIEACADEFSEFRKKDSLLLLLSPAGESEPVDKDFSESRLPCALVLSLVDECVASLCHVSVVVSYEEDDTACRIKDTPWLITFLDGAENVGDCPLGAPCITHVLLDGCCS